MSILSPSHAVLYPQKAGLLDQDTWPSLPCLCLPFELSQCEAMTGGERAEETPPVIDVLATSLPGQGLAVTVSLYPKPEALLGSIPLLLWHSE